MLALRRSLPADYTYYNMDQVIERAMLVFRLFQV